MKVLGVYDQNCEIRCNNKSIFYVMKKFFDRLPSEYGECYFRNLEDLILIKIVLQQLINILLLKKVNSGKKKWIAKKNIMPILF